MGLGPAHTISLAEAREAALQCRKARLAGLDPINQRNEQRAAEAQASAKAIKFAEAADGYVRAMLRAGATPSTRRNGQRACASMYFRRSARCRSRRSTRRWS